MTKEPDPFSGEEFSLHLAPKFRADLVFKSLRGRLVPEFTRRISSVNLNVLIQQNHHEIEESTSE
jgi:hypothetical protein